jgi:hypothetical protein
VGAPAIDPRTDLLALAKITQEKQAEAVSKAFDKKLALLEATRTQFFTDKGVVTDARTQAALEVQLKAAEAIDRMTGVLAPPASTKVTMTHTFEIPEWFRTPDQAALSSTTLEIDVAPSQDSNE